MSVRIVSVSATASMVAGASLVLLKKRRRETSLPGVLMIAGFLIQFAVLIVRIPATLISGFSGEFLNSPGFQVIIVLAGNLTMTAWPTGFTILISHSNQQKGYAKYGETRSILTDVQSRIYSMALVHQQLYQQDNLDIINLKLYLENLIDSIKASYQDLTGKIDFRSQMNDIDVPIQSAIPCGLILNELYSNAVKYAFQGRNDNCIITTSKWRNDDSEIVLNVADNGVGFPADFDFESISSHHLHIVKVLTQEQLQGKILFGSDNGFSCTVVFK